ncbi:MAG: MGMT family protein [Acidobacteriota bacterium]
MSLRFSIALLVLAAALAYALFKLRQARPTGGSEPASGEVIPQERLHQLIAAIPRGRVLTFAALLRQCGPDQEAGEIARAVRALAEQDHLPWWRVVRQEGTLGQVPPASAIGKKQQALLAEEGVKLQRGSFPLEDYEWESEK